MKTRRFAALVSALTAVTLAAACSSGTNAGGDDKNTLTLASVDQGSIEDVVKAFEAANPGVKVNFTTSGADQYQAQIRTQLSSGTAPDVMTVWPGNGNPGATYVLSKPGYLLDLSDQPWAAKLPDSFKQVAQYEGKTYNALFGLNGIGAVYNDEALSKSGLKAPTTWTDLMSFCRDAAGKGTPAYALGIQDNWVTQLVLYALAATVVFGQDKDFNTKLAAGQTTFAGSAWTQAMAKYTEMDKAGCFQKNPLGTSYEASQTLAATGKTLGIIQGNWIITLLKGKNPNGKFTMTALPATDNAATFLMPAAAGAGYGVNAKAKNKELALKFITYVMSPEGMKLFNEKQGSLPTLPDAGTTVDPGLKQLTTFVGENKTVPFMDQLWPNAKVQQTMLSGLQEVFSNQATADDVLKDMDTEYKKGE
ncbi:extracellular solute-binding protein [Micromonospora parathelypteridis]|uniref:Raffinose/stachyose/melibiose transport system substrate-binding protein n=1 Tax=Micromonospora parathelypteridis TaxID=1839617 RepID=A0A840W6G5_9ACTN|nr:extracellular solute-binding protein [Micromonospora parathelypteridis]MBB5480658.1 raffinose/stachyose/melibiose transport system substrate-binding protein [Micromonospora parathelypteridis]GGO22320.1 ABC transporter substrate-binding protein [Micromonospora parathelypteridis]